MSGPVPKINTVGLDGIAAELVEVEADLNVGLHSFNKVARTIADLDGEEKVNSKHLAEAFRYRVKENKY